MKITNALKLIATSAGISWANSVFAHDGHGMGGAHWHATDTAGFVAVAALVALAIWRSGGGKK